MNTVDRLIRAFEIDVGRCVAVLLFASATTLSYASLFGALSIHTLRIGTYIWFFVGILGVQVCVAGCEFWLAFSLWKHRPVARKIFVVLIWLFLSGLFLAALFGPFLDSYRVSITGFSMTNPPNWLRVFIPLSATPLAFALLLAFDCPATREKFKGA